MTVSADVELLRPALSEESAYGVEAPNVPGKGQWRFGTAVQYERAPVLVLVDEELSTQPVSDRVGAWLGVSAGLGRRVALQATVPFAWQQGNDPGLSANGMALADPRLGARWGAVDGDILDAGLRADLVVPLGQDDAWMGESTVRGAVGATGSVDGRFGSLVADLGLTIRSLETPRPGLDWGPSVDWGVGVRVPLGARLGVSGAWAGRAVVAGLDAKDGEVASEALAGADLKLGEALVLGGGAGMGVQGGVGASTLRGFVHATWTVTREKKPVVEDTLVIDPPPPVDVTKMLEEEVPFIVVPPEWMDDQHVKVAGDEIKFREEIKFAPGSAEILPESLPIVAEIADLLAQDGRIAHVAIEGHASDEGGLAYNWELSDRRARAVWEQLIREGVHPDRMSWRGLGEVDPVRPGAPEAARPADRRVVLRIARRLAQGEVPAALPATILLPWNGESSAVDAVVVPEPPPPPDAQKIPRDAVDPTLFEDEDAAPPEEEAVDPSTFKDDEEEE